MESFNEQVPGNNYPEHLTKPIFREPTKAVVRILKMTVYEKDIQIVNNDATKTLGKKIIVHEGVGIIDKAGKSLKNFKEGDHVLISCVTSCGKCENCSRIMYSFCEKSGWIFGNFIESEDSGISVIPYEDNNPIPDPELTENDYRWQHDSNFIK